MFFVFGLMMVFVMFGVVMVVVFLGVWFFFVVGMVVFVGVDEEGIMLLGIGEVFFVCLGV